KPVVLGDVQAGLLYGATIQLLFMGGIEAGGNIPSDQALAACIAIPAAIINNMDPQVALALAVPFGVLGVLINNVRRTVNTFFTSRSDKLVEEEKYDTLSLFSFLIPWLVNGVLYFTPVFITTLFGPDVVEAFINVIPQWAMDGLANAGGILPALGFALTIVILGRKQYLPFFCIGILYVYSFRILDVNRGCFCSNYCHDCVAI